MSTLLALTCGCVYADHAQLMAMVKADGYGHGATRVAQTALGAGAAELGVATVDGR